MGAWNRVGLLGFFLSLQQWLTWLNISNKLWTTGGKCAKPDNPAGVPLSVCGADENIVFGPNSGGRRCLFLFPQSAKWLLRPCDLFGVNVRLLEQNHSALMPKHSSWHEYVLCRCRLFYLPFLFLCLFCWGDYFREKAGFSVELGIARKIGLLSWRVGRIFPLQLG